MVLGQGREGRSGKVVRGYRNERKLRIIMSTRMKRKDPDK